jgi:hypothetical protein
MKYKFLLSYTPTDGTATTPRQCHPLYSDQTNIEIQRASGEWYYTRKLDGKLTFVRDDYTEIMSRPFDGTFTLTIQSSINDGSSWNNYFSASFSRANLEIDEDNRTATLNGLTEGIANLIENGKRDEYDLMKLIPQTELKTVKGQIQPALAMVDYRAESIPASDIYSGGPLTANGYKSGEDTDWSEDEKVVTDNKWLFVGIYSEAQVKMKTGYTIANGHYAGTLHYSTTWTDKFFPVGTLTSENGCSIIIDTYSERDDDPPHSLTPYRRIRILDPDNNELFEDLTVLGAAKTSPSSLYFDYTQASGMWLDKLEIFFHYIRATLLTFSDTDREKNILDTGPYYLGMSAFEGSGLSIYTSTRSVEEDNGHRLVPGSDENGGIPRYFAPPDDNHNYIPLAEDNWNYASFWYLITPSVQNGLLDPSLIGTFTWGRCWTIGCCIKYLLNRITKGQVLFDEDTFYSRFLYDTVNPVQGHEPFDYLVTQKSNIMRGTAESAARCPVTLDWFLELLRNAFNCYYWFEKTNAGRYYFHIEHVEYFRRGGQYSGSLPHQLDLTAIKPYRNFRRNLQPVKRLSDGTNRYSYNLDNLAERFNFKWQGEGGSDDFKGYPMLFRAGWVTEGLSESHEVDNIFADLQWLMLNAGTDTASAKNYEGIFLFSAYRAATLDSAWAENSAPIDRVLVLSEGQHLVAFCHIWLTAPHGYQFTLHKDYDITTYTGTGQQQLISIAVDDMFIGGFHSLFINFGTDYANITIHRIHATDGNTYLVPNLPNLLRSGYIHNGALAWPHLQNEYLHYDIPAQRWSYNTDDPLTATFRRTGTVKMCKKQTVGIVPALLADIDTNQGIKTGLGTGIIDSAKINLLSRNAELTILYDPAPQTYIPIRPFDPPTPPTPPITPDTPDITISDDITP